MSVPAVITYGTADTTLGLMFVARTGRGVCALFLIGPEEEGLALGRVRKQFPGAPLVRDQAAAEALGRRLDEVVAGRQDAGHIPLDLHGIPFQQRVWNALARVPRGATCSYADLARQAGFPKAVRAVAGACAANPVAVLVPCHRVVRRDGGLGGYYWGLECKRALLRLEGIENHGA